MKSFANLSNTEIKNNHKQISLNVAKIRKSKNITQLDLALTIGLTSATFISNAEQNRYNKHFNIEHLFKIAKALNVNIKDFFDF